MGMLKRSNMDPPCPFSVEVTVSVSDDSSETSLNSTVASNIVGVVREGGDEESPALVPVGTGGGSDTDDSFSQGDDDDDDDTQPHGVRVEERSSSRSSKGSASKPMHMQTTTDTVGVIDCLSDQFSNMFCSSDHHNDSGYQCTSDTSLVDRSLNCVVPETDASDVFASLNFWLSPSDEEKLADTHGKHPRNRISARGHKTSYVKQVWDHWHPENSVPIERSKSMQASNEPPQSLMDLQFDVFYDSDPESEYNERHSRGKSLVEPKLTKRRSYRTRRPPAIETVHEDEFKSTTGAPIAPRNGPRFSLKLAGRQQSPEGCRTLLPPGSPRSLNDHYLLHLQHDDFLRQYVQEVSNARVNLVWHRLPSHGAKRPIQAPVAVMGAFEVGAHLDQLVIQPKFTWSPAYEGDLEKRKFRLSGGQPHAVELLSIIRVVKPKKLDRELYPFARLDRTCCISTNDERFPYLVFEASSPRQRDWLVTALKMTVARLASIIIVRDEARLMEFFSPYAAIMSLADGVDCDDEHEETTASAATRTTAPVITPPSGPPPPLEKGEGKLLSFAV